MRKGKPNDDRVQQKDGMKQEGKNLERSEKAMMRNLDPKVLERKEAMELKQTRQQEKIRVES